MPTEQLDTEVVSEAPEPSIEEQVKEGFAEISKETSAADSQQPSGDEKSAAPPADDSSGEEEKATFHPDLLEAARSYGMEETDISSLETNEALGRTISMFDRYMLRPQEVPPENGEVQQRPRDEQGRFVTPPAQEPSPGPSDNYPTGTPHYAFESEEEYDDGLLRMNEHHNKRGDSIQQELSMVHEGMQFLQNMEMQRMSHADTEIFDSALDSMDNTLFGKDASSITPEQYERREKLYRDVRTMRDNLNMNSRDSRMSNALVKRAAQQVFASEMETQRQQVRTSDIRNQSNKRLGGPGGRVTPDAPWDGKPEDNPALHAHFDRLEREGQGA